jgi:hypothetical protein
MNKTAVKRYWMEAEGPMGERVDSDESSVQVVLASDYDALKSREAVYRNLLEQVYAIRERQPASLVADIRAALAQVPK